jgi:Tfp pilus assembly protein PilV
MKGLRSAVGYLSHGALPRLGGRLDRNRRGSAIGRSTQPQTANRSGFVLWEMLLGLAIFCVGAIALTTALQQAVDTVILIRDESEVRQDLESIMAEASVNKLQAGKTAIFMADHRIQYEREVTSLPAKNWKGQPVASLWHVTVRATWLARNRVRTSEAQEVFFQP